MKHHKTNGFLTLLQRYMSNAANKKEKEAMDIWYDSLGEPTQDIPDAQQKKHIEQRMWRNVEQATIGGSTQPTVKPLRYWNSSIFRIATAASVILALGLVYFFTDLVRNNAFPVDGVSREEIIALEKVTNYGNTPRTIGLADGSRVVLESDATLYYPKTFGEQNRTVYLDGDGFFDIAKNPNKPFLVYSGDIVTKVLGTSFTIHRDKVSGNMEVAVITGKVIVEKSDKSGKFFEVKNPGVLLTPNEKVSFLPEKQEYITGLVEKPVIIENSAPYTVPNAFVFDDTTLSTILSKLEKAYGVEIQVQNKAILNCTVTADLGTDNLFTQLDILDVLLNSESSVKGKIIVISGGECKPFLSKTK